MPPSQRSISQTHITSEGPALLPLFLIQHTLWIYTARSSWRALLLVPLVLLRRRLSFKYTECSRGNGEQLLGRSVGTWLYLILRKSSSSSRLSQLRCRSVARLAEFCCSAILVLKGWEAMEVMRFMEAGAVRHWLKSGGGVQETEGCGEVLDSKAADTATVTALCLLFCIIFLCMHFLMLFQPRW